MQINNNAKGFKKIKKHYYKITKITNGNNYNEQKHYCLLLFNDIKLNYYETEHHFTKNKTRALQIYHTKYKTGFQNNEKKSYFLYINN